MGKLIYRVVTLLFCLALFGWYIQKEDLCYGTLLYLGETRAENADFLTASKLYEIAISIHPNEPRGYYFLGKSLECIKASDKALEVLNNGLSVAPEDYYLLILRGEILYHIGNYDKSIEDLTAAIIADPSQEEAYAYRGLSKVGLHDYDGAYKDYTTAIRINPMDPGPYNNRGLINLLFNKRYKDAMSDFDKAFKLRKEPMFIYNRGYAYFFLRNNMQAKKDYDTAKALDPHFSREYYPKQIARIIWQSINDQKSM